MMKIERCGSTPPKASKCGLGCCCVIAHKHTKTLHSALCGAQWTGLGSVINRHDEKPADISEAQRLIDLGVFRDHTGHTIITLLLPGCGGGDHKACHVASPRIGTKDQPGKWIGWYHCSCECHEFKKTKNGWKMGPAKDWKESQ